jgi:hypothetical protein
MGVNMLNSDIFEGSINILVFFWGRNIMDVFFGVLFIFLVIIFLII